MSPEAAESQANSYEDGAREEPPNLLNSPLNFGKLAVGVDANLDHEVEASQRREAKSVIILESLISSNSRQDKMQRDSLLLRKSNLMCNSKEMATLSMRISS